MTGQHALDDVVDNEWILGPALWLASKNAFTVSIATGHGSCSAAGPGRIAPSVVLLAAH